MNASSGDRSLSLSGSVARKRNFGVATESQLRARSPPIEYRIYVGNPREQLCPNFPRTDRRFGVTKCARPIPLLIREDKPALFSFLNCTRNAREREREKERTTRWLSCRRTQSAAKKILVSEGERERQGVKMERAEPGEKEREREVTRSKRIRGSR